LHRANQFFHKDQAVFYVLQLDDLGRFKPSKTIHHVGALADIKAERVKD
jgi:hypothetical protein